MLALFSSLHRKPRPQTTEQGFLIEVQHRMGNGLTQSPLDCLKTTKCHASNPDEWNT